MMFLHDKPMPPSSPHCSPHRWHGLELHGLTLHFAGATGRASSRGFPGEIWRGLLGQALSRAVCSYPHANCHNCVLLSGCAYPALFKPLDATRLPPFWPHGWQAADRGWHVGLRWLGKQDYALSQWLSALARPSTRGEKSTEQHFLGAPVRLEKASHALTGETLWTPHRQWQNLPQPLPLPAPLPEEAATQGCRVRFLTPLVSKHEGDPLYGALHTRVQRLVQAHGDGQTLSRPDRPWQCRVLGQQPLKKQLARRPLQGTLWEVALTDIAPEALTLLTVGQELHAGGQTTSGCGQYQLLPLAATTEKTGTTSTSY
ncbi:MAG: hypothetical protein KBD39_04855 [Sterolibacterium sp.]|nr:hypothetical protein [Sterolibacterium sp.]MBP9799430.1 hypothetical protein [Sterolibacterium sp.]